MKPGTVDIDGTVADPTARAQTGSNADAAGGAYPLRLALLAQMLGVLAAGSLALGVFQGLLTHPLGAASLQGFCALLAAWWLRAPVWWLLIHLVFAPCAVLAHGMELPPWLWAGAFLLLLLVFWRTDTSRVPLYLTNSRSRDALVGLLPPIPCRVIDLGCGDGAVLRHLARLRPDCLFVGVEHAPLPWVWAWLSARSCANLIIRRGDFWSHPLADYAVVYAFLSPAAMPRLGARIDAEMSPGTRLISNTFPIPQRVPQAVIDVADRRRTRFYVYDLPRL